MCQRESWSASARFRCSLRAADCGELLPNFAADSFDVIVTNPHYGLTPGKVGSGLASLNENSRAGRARNCTGGVFEGHRVRNLAAFGEQGFDSGGRPGGSDLVLRENKFGGRFVGCVRRAGTSSMRTASCTAPLIDLRKKLLPLRRGRQVLHRVSEDGVHFGLPHRVPGRPSTAWAPTRPPT